MSKPIVCPFADVAEQTSSAQGYIRNRTRRGVVVVVENRTDLPLTHVSSSFGSGTYHIPPSPVIPPRMACVFIVRNRSVSFMTGVQGIATFETPLHSLCVAFDSPFAGTYKSWCSILPMGTEMPPYTLEFAMSVIHELGGASPCPPYLLRYGPASMVQHFTFEIDAGIPLTPALAHRIPFHVLQYNVFARPYLVSFDGQKERLERIPGEKKRPEEGIVRSRF